MSLFMFNCIPFLSNSALDPLPLNLHVNPNFFINRRIRNACSLVYVPIPYVYRLYGYVGLLVHPLGLVFRSLQNVNVALIRFNTFTETTSQFSSALSNIVFNMWTLGLMLACGFAQNGCQYSLSLMHFEILPLICGLTLRISRHVELHIYLNTC